MGHGMQRSTSKLDMFCAVGSAVGGINDWINLNHSPYASSPFAHASANHLLHTGRYILQEASPHWHNSQVSIKTHGKSFDIGRWWQAACTCVGAANNLDIVG